MNFGQRVGERFDFVKSHFREGETVLLRYPMMVRGEQVVAGTIARFDERGKFVVLHPINAPGEEFDAVPQHILKMNPAGGRRIRKSRKSLRKSRKSLRKTKNTRRTR